MAKSCCPNCIGDRHIRRTFTSDPSATLGACDYCSSSQQPLIDPTQLRDYFELLIGCYTLNDDGKTLVEWFKDDWELFSHEKMDLANSTLLLSEILNDGNVTRESFIPAGNSSETLRQWALFREELLHENRFFPNNVIDSERLKKLLEYLIIPEDEYQKTWYRARIQKDDSPYTSDKMGAPPGKLASHGRANPAGIPYLYLATDTSTAISEIRPHTGQIANVAEVTIPDNLKIVDLRNPKHTVSPFFIGDEAQIILLRSELRYLQHLGNELTRPVLPDTAAIDYIPTQYLCEFVKKYGYDGVMYRSSVGNGENIALFKPEHGTFGKVSSRIVSRVSVETVAS